MSERSELIAKTIFDWLNNQDEEGVTKPCIYGEPYDDNDPLIVGVDGPMDCGKLAAAIDAALIAYDAPDLYEDMEITS